MRTSPHFIDDLADFAIAGIAYMGRCFKYVETMIRVVSSSDTESEPEPPPAPPPPPLPVAPPQVPLPAAAVNEVFTDGLPPLFDPSLRAFVTTAVGQKYPITVTVDAPDGNEDFTPIMSFLVHDVGYLDLRDFFHTADPVAVSRLRTALQGQSPPRTVAGAAMEWVAHVAARAGVLVIGLSDGWRDEGHFPVPGTIQDVALALLGPTPANRTDQMRSLIRKAQRFHGEAVDDTAALTPQVVAYISRVRDHGYYGGFGFSQTATDTVMSASPSDILRSKLRGAFVDLTV